MVNKKGGETKSHLALFTGALVLEEKSIQGLQNNPSVPPWYPHRKIQKKKKVYNKAFITQQPREKRGGGRRNDYREEKSLAAHRSTVA